MLLPGDLLVGTTERKLVALVNQSHSAVDFEWMNVHEPHLAQVEPPSGRIPANSSFQCSVGITGCVPGKLDVMLECVIERMESRLVLPIEANIKGCETFYWD